MKKKKLDPYKVDKKYLYPHGVAPPMKNCRKRRFRKTLKKKYVEAPEIEKEVRVGMTWFGCSNSVWFAGEEITAG